MKKSMDIGEGNIGIEDISFSVPKYYISAKDLAEYRNVDPNKYSDGLGVEKIAILKDENLVQLTSRALNDLLIRNNLDSKDISRIYVATESSIDESRSLAEFILEESEREFGTNAFTHISPPVELKQACISSSVGLENLCRFTKDTKEKSILLIADEAIYDLNTSGEPTQGCGAAAILIENDPSLLELNFKNCGYYNAPIYDFYRPSGKDVPIVDGHFSNFAYLFCMRNAYDDFVKKNKKNIDNFDYFCFHTPYPKMASYAFASLLIHTWRDTDKIKQIENFIGKEPKLLNKGSLENMRDDKNYIKKYFDYNKKFRETDLFKKIFLDKVNPSLKCSSLIGNIYSGSLYLCLGCLIENGRTKNNSEIGFGAFGSGASVMMFSGKLKKKKNLCLGEQLIYRDKLSIEDYEDLRFERRRR